MSINILQSLVGIIFLTILYLHLSKKNISAVVAYALQSLAIVLVFINAYLETNSLDLLAVVAVTLLVKVLLAPIFFVRLIKKHNLTFSVNTYLSIPLTLVMVAVFTAMAYSAKFEPLTNLISNNKTILSVALAALFLSILLVINHKNAISQALGVLSLENSIVAFAVFAGLEQSPMLQLGIMFDIMVWLVIASVFVSMIYRHFGSLDTSLMQHLKD